MLCMEEEQVAAEVRRIDSESPSCLINCKFDNLTWKAVLIFFQISAIYNCERTRTSMLSVAPLTATGPTANFPPSSKEGSGISRVSTRSGSSAS